MIGFCLEPPDYKKQNEVYEYYQPNFVFMDANLHRDLNLIVKTPNCQIDGKYKKVRLYLFETPNLIISAECETGDRGSGWFCVEKSNTNSRKGYYSPTDLLGFSPENLKELSYFMRYMVWHLIDKNTQNKHDCLDYPDFLNSLESQFGTFSLKKQNKM